MAAFIADHVPHFWHKWRFIAKAVVRGFHHDARLCALRFRFWEQVDAHAPPLRARMCEATCEPQKYVASRVIMLHHLLAGR
jgi:hypothetical protein